MIKAKGNDPKAIMVGETPAKAIYRGEQLVWSGQQDDYIQNGLICWLDGIKNTPNGHEDAFDKWYDLSNHGNHGIVRGNIEVLTDRVKTTSNGSIELNQNIASTTYRYEILTRYQHSRALDVYAFMGGALNYPSLIVSGVQHALEFNTGEPSFTYGISINDKILVDNSVMLFSFRGEIGNENVYINGNQKNLTRFANNYTPSRPYYLGRRVDNYYPHEFLCIRVYNRELTEAEIKHNYAVDKKRFKI